jgi:hypothetical protein
MSRASLRYSSTHVLALHSVRVLPLGHARAGHVRCSFARTSGHVSATFFTHALLPAVDVPHPTQQSDGPLKLTNVTAQSESSTQCASRGGTTGVDVGDAITTNTKRLIAKIFMVRTDVHHARSF